MKKLNKLNLVSLGDKEFTKQELINMRGGYSGGGSCCGCACNGPSSDHDNFWANHAAGHYDSIGGGARYCWHHGEPLPSDDCY